MAGPIDFDDDPHRRYNPLTDEWVLVSPYRTKRPWQGAEETPAPESRPAYDPSCYLCPGNVRANGDVNPDYEGTYVFANDFAALLPGGEESRETPGLFRAQTVHGECRVICFSPRHDLSMAQMPDGDIRRVVEAWIGQVDDLGRRYPWVQIMENRGAAMGASNPHPHGQVWASDRLPTIAGRETASQARYLADQGRPLLLDVAEAESRDGARTVEENDEWILVVPFWATWPFEYLLLPKKPAGRLPDLSAAARESLAQILGRGLRRYDALFQTAFPYSMGWHGAPMDGLNHPEWQVHAHFYPPLLRSATVRKFMVGYEMLAEPQRDLTPEQAAGRLRAAIA